MIKSKDHVEFIGKFEFFRFNDSIYRVDSKNVIDVNTGYRVGSRWECYDRDWDLIARRYRKGLRVNLTITNDRDWYIEELDILCDSVDETRIKAKEFGYDGIIL
jgi:hypothetical protein